MRRALVGGIAISLGAAPIGVFLMLRRMSLIGDAMAHAILPGAAIGFILGGISLGAMTLGGLVAGFGVALAAGLVARTTLVKEDMSLAAFYLVSLALGVTILSASRANIDVLSLLFGSILALDDATLLLIASVASLTLAALAFAYRGVVMECLDPGFAAGVSRAGALFHLGFLMLVVLNLVAGFHALGTLLVVGIMMIPAAIARL
jgi:zinc/manganese transport system permease protein